MEVKVGSKQEDIHGANVRENIGAQSKAKDGEKQEKKTNANVEANAST